MTSCKILHVKNKIVIHISMYNILDWLSGWMTDWLTGWLADWLTDWLTDWLQMGSGPRSPDAPWP